VIKRTLATILLLAASLAAQTTLTNLELRTDWQGCGNCANTGATGATAIGGLRFTGREFFISPDPLNPTAFQNLYAYLAHGAQNQATHVEHEWTFTISKADELKPQALEFEIQQQLPLGLVSNCAFQFRPSDKSIRNFNFAAGSAQNGGTSVGDPWEATGATFTPFAGDVPHHAKLVYDRHPDLSYDCSLVDLDGPLAVPVTKKRQMWRAPDALLSKFGAKLNSAIQLDMNPARGGYVVQIKDVNVSWR
jgi:hypothetical protein